MFSFIIFIVVIVVFCIKFDLVRYKTCPTNRAMIVYGKKGIIMDPIIVTSGGTLVFPFIHEYNFLSLEPMSIFIDTDKENYSGLLTKSGTRVKLKANFSVAISKHRYLLQIAAQHLLGMNQKDIIQLAKDIILGETRLVFASMTIDEIYEDVKEKNNLKQTIKVALKNIGMEFISCNIENITDCSGYKEAQERTTSEKESFFSDEFKELAQKEKPKEDIIQENINNSLKETLQDKIQETEDYIDETVYIEIEKAVTKNNEEISLAPNFKILLTKELMKKYLSLPEFNEKVKNLLTEKVNSAISSYTYEEIAANTKEFEKEVLKQVSEDLSLLNIKILKVNLLGLFNISQYMATLDKEELAQNETVSEEKTQDTFILDEITEQKNDFEQAVMNIMNPKEEIEQAEEVLQTEEPENKEELKEEEPQDVQTTLPLNDTQAQIDDIFASTRKYFEKNSST